MKAMILAAGRGSRMRPLTNNTPKPLLKIQQFSLIEHLLLSLAAHGFHDIVINLAYLGNQIRDTLQDGKHYGVNIAYSLEPEEGGLESGGGIYQALPLLGPDPFLVVSGDIWTNYPFSQLKYITLSSLAHLVLVANPPYHTQGDFNLAGAKISTHTGQRLTFGNMGIYHPDLFANCQPGFFGLAPLLHQAAVREMLTGEYFQGEWINVGTPEALFSLRQKIITASQDGVATTNSNPGVLPDRCYDPSHTHAKKQDN